ncbi:MAG TPA: ferredoxin family protein [Thermoanaerobaculia bacterium]|nr:ferredoxin family protein [Thermoanaerobaculia bacterium]
MSEAPGGHGTRETPAAGLRVVLYEGPGSLPVTSERRFEILSTLLAAGYQVTRALPGGEVAPADETPLLVLGRFESGETPRDRRDREGAALLFRDLDGLDGERLAAAVAEISGELGAAAPGAWIPWFPVIDYDRCTNCMQCLSFCLFGVYGVDGDDRIAVQNESSCKTNCPACSRVCPEAAIMFPKYGKGPINGDVVRAEDLRSESMKVDITALLGGDLYAALRTRQSEARVRFSTERDESRALLERKRCLKKLQQAYDIPDEVLMSLPSAGDIEERARRAREKRAQRMERSQTARDRRATPSEEDWGI